MRFDVAVIVRIILRYGIGALTVWGVLPEGWADVISTDPDIQMILDLSLTAALGALVEYWMVKAEAFKAKREEDKIERLKAQISDKPVKKKGT